MTWKLKLPQGIDSVCLFDMLRTYGIFRQCRCEWYYISFLDSLSILVYKRAFYIVIKMRTSAVEWHFFVYFEQNKYDNDKNCWSKSHFFTSAPSEQRYMTTDRCNQSRMLPWQQTKSLAQRAIIVTIIKIICKFIPKRSSSASSKFPAAGSKFSMLLVLILNGCFKLMLALFRQKWHNWMEQQRPSSLSLSYLHSVYN
jgi:hypothetical protein